MGRVLPAGIVLSALLVVWECGPAAHAEQLKERRANPAHGPSAHGPSAHRPFAGQQRAAYDWAGPYAGINVGVVQGSYDPTTAILPSSSYISHPRDVSAVNAAGAQSIKPLGFLGGIQAGYNWQFGHAVLGLEADLDYLHLNGAANSGGIRFPAGGSGFFSGGFRLNQFVISSYAGADWLFTLRPRAGVAIDNWLFYATGGLALTKLQGQFLFTDGNAAGGVTGAAQEADVRAFKAGYTVGGGVETAITDRLRLKTEYSYVNFGTVQANETSSNLACCFTPPAAQTFIQSMDLRAHFVRAGLNYSFGGSAQAESDAYAWLPPRMPALRARQPITDPSNWEFDVGTRVWLSSGTVGAPQPLLNLPPLPSQIESRLTYEHVNAASGETFGRADHASGFFVKGLVGAGGIASGTLVDEDFPGFGGAYSNTVTPIAGHLAYANIDVGTTFLTARGAKVGAFVGYSYFTQHINGYGCTQVAGDTTCVGLDPNFQVFAEDQHYNALRIGLAAEFMLTDKLKFSADAAYLPWVHFRGQDDHNARQLLIPESSSNGDGMMFEAILGYAVTPNWNVGVGGRYWAWNMHDGVEYFNFLGLPQPTVPQLGRFNSERYGFFFQADYHWGAVMAAPQPRGASVAAAADTPTRWTGVYVGGHVGGAWSDNRWSDPFGSTTSAGLVNVAGFGDTIHGTGPIAGVQAGFNWQTGPWVVGLQGGWSKTDIRGENTCFSGIGGLNCQQIINAVATLAGRIGFAWDHALAYAKGGAAYAGVDYMLLGDTGGDSRGYGSTHVAAWGWTVGGGLEYALSDRWTTMIEYEHIGFDNAVTFPSVALVNTQVISIKQSIDTLKLGVNYRFDWPRPSAARS